MKQPIDCQDCKRAKEVVCKGTAYMVDECIADIVDAINNHPNLRTASTCCGHGITKASFIVCNNSDDYMFVEIDLHTPLELWDKYRPFHEAMLRGK